MPLSVFPFFTLPWGGQKSLTENCICVYNVHMNISIRRLAPTPPSTPATHVRIRTLKNSPSPGVKGPEQYRESMTTMKTMNQEKYRRHSPNPGSHFRGKSVRKLQIAAKLLSNAFLFLLSHQPTSPSSPGLTLPKPSTPSPTPRIWQNSVEAFQGSPENPLTNSPHHPPLPPDSRPISHLLTPLDFPIPSVLTLSCGVANSAFISNTSSCTIHQSTTLHPYTYHAPVTPDSCPLTIAVGTAVAGGPPHRSVREVLPHTAPALSRARNRSSG